MLYFYLFIFIQIILESLPISSSGHLLLLEKLFEKLELPISYIPKGLDYFLHFFMFLIILFVFYPAYKNILFLFFNIIHRKDFYSWKAKKLFSIIKKLFIYGFIIDFITLAFYFLVKLDFINNHSKNLNLLFIGFLISFIFLFLALLKSKEKVSFEGLDLKKSIILGMMQGISLFSGISRFGITYSVAFLLNLTSKRAFELSFLLELPICLGGSFLGFYLMLKGKSLSMIFYPGILTIIFSATLISAILFNQMYKLAKKSKIGFFAFYFIIPMLLIFMLN